MLEIGADLLAAQEVMANQKNGVFLSWLDLECDYSKSTAYRFISAARVFGNIITSQFGTLSDSAMYLLAANNCPHPATEEALKLSKQGKPVTHKIAKQLIANSTQPADSRQIAEPTLEPIEEPEPELWEQFAAKHDEALNHLTQAIKAMNWIEKQGDSAAYLVPVMTRIQTDYKALRGTIFSNCPVNEKAGKIVTKVQERK